MSHVRVHYHPDTGRILAWDNSQSGPALMGGKIVTIDIPDGHDVTIDPTAQRIDLVTLELEDMSEAEIAIARGPQSWELKNLIFSELDATDSLLTVTDRYVPNRAEWTAYRQALRDASRPTIPEPDAPRPSPIEMTEAIPVRPDGRDAAALLRARLPQG